MTLSAGCAEVDLTPRGECDLTGFVGHRQPSLGVKKAIKGRVLWLDAGHSRALVAVCDLLGFTPDDSRRIESAMSAAAGMPARRVFLACTHSHAAPMSMPLGTVGRHRPAYVDFILRRMVWAVRAAVRDAAPVLGLRFGRRDVSELGQFRCATREPGRDRWPGAVSAARIERSGAPSITLVHLGVHPYVLGPRNRWVHPDYPGATCDAVAAHTGGRALFLPGCGADVSPVGGMGASSAAVRRYGERVAEAALAALAEGCELAVAAPRCRLVVPRVRFSLTGASRRMGRPADGGNEEALSALAAGGDRPALNHLQWLDGLRRGAWPRSARFPIHVLRLGTLVLAGLPAEVFHDTGEDLAAAFPGLQVLTVSQTGGDIGYLPRAFAYRHATYEAAQAHEWYRTGGPAAPGAEAAVRRAAARGILRVTPRLRPAAPPR